MNLPFNYKVDGKVEEGYIHRVLQRGFRWCFKDLIFGSLRLERGEHGDNMAEHNDIY